VEADACERSDVKRKDPTTKCIKCRPQKKKKKKKKGKKRFAAILFISSLP
jgi:hypothetical protein